MTPFSDLSHPSGSLTVGCDLSLILRCSISSSPYSSSLDVLLSSPLDLLWCIHIGSRPKNTQNWAPTSPYIATVTSNVDFYAYFRCCLDSPFQTRHDGRAAGGIWSSVNHSRDVRWFKLNRAVKNILKWRQVQEPAQVSSIMNIHPEHFFTLAVQSADAGSVHVQTVVCSSTGWRNYVLGKREWSGSIILEFRDIMR